MRQYDYWFTEAWGYYEVIGRYFRRNKEKISLVILANDESPENRCIIENCLKYDIKTLYTQHASADYSYPNIIFSYSFLDGYDSYKKYSAYYPVRGIAFLSGCPRFDCFYGQKEPVYIGIATSIADDMDKVLELCAFLKTNGYNNLILRPHPRQNLSKEINDELIDMGIRISDPHKENSYMFLARLILLIANNSSIHYDAMIAKIPSVKFNLSDKEDTDGYSFVSSGITIHCKTFEDILNECKKPKLISADRIKEWNGAANTKYEGHVADVISSFITTFLDENDSIDEWIDSLFTYNVEGYYVYK